MVDEVANIRAPPTKKTYHPMRCFTVSLIAVLVLCGVFGVIYSMFPREDFGFQGVIDPLYFSATVLSTVGFGDFSPKTTGAKVVVTTQMLLTAAGVVVLLSRLASPRG